MFSLTKMNKDFKRKISYAPENTRIYAVGDIHGRYDLLQILHERIILDAVTAKNMRKVIIYIGDYVDRGPQSKQVIDSFANNPMAGFEQVFIKGNHENVMQEFLDNPSASKMWLSWGGNATIKSYGINPDDFENLEGLREAFKSRIPDSHFEFFNKLKIYHVEGDYLFVHAGIKPGVELEKQTANDMMMIREEFYFPDNPSPDKTVVFGHTIFENPFYEAGKLGIDTGAFATGKLTAAVLEGDSVRFVSTVR